MNKFAVVFAALMAVAAADYQPKVHTSYSAPAPVYGVPFVPKPAEVYGVPQVIVKTVVPIESKYKYTIPVAPVPVYGVPKAAPIKSTYKYAIPVAPVPVYGLPAKIEAKVAPYPAKIIAKVAPYPAKPIVSTYSFKVEEPKPAAVYGVPAPVYGVPPKVEVKLAPYPAAPVKPHTEYGVPRIEVN